MYTQELPGGTGFRKVNTFNELSKSILQLLSFEIKPQFLNPKYSIIKNTNTWTWKNYKISIIMAHAY